MSSHRHPPISGLRSEVDGSAAEGNKTVLGKSMSLLHLRFNVISYEGVVGAADLLAGALLAQGIQESDGRAGY